MHSVLNSIPLTVMSILMLVSMIFLFKLMSKNYELGEKILDLKEISKSKDSIIESLKKKDKVFLPGNRVYLHKYSLSTKGSNKIDFSVSYEANIIDVSQTKVKISAYDFSSHDSYANDPKNHKSIIDFMQNKWVDKNSLELIMSDSDLRDEKLNNLLT